MASGAKRGRGHAGKFVRGCFSTAAGGGSVKTCDAASGKALLQSPTLYRRGTCARGAGDAPIGFVSAAKWGAKRVQSRRVRRDKKERGRRKGRLGGGPSMVCLWQAASSGGPSCEGPHAPVPVRRGVCRDYDCAACGLFDSARRSRSATVLTFSFSMMFARCASTVLMLMPRSSAICLFRRPAMMRSST